MLRISIANCSICSAITPFTERSRLLSRFAGLDHFKKWESKNHIQTCLAVLSQNLIRTFSPLVTLCSYCHQTKNKTKY